jgi:hypothetical protein
MNKINHLKLNIKTQVPTQKTIYVESFMVLFNSLVLLNLFAHLGWYPLEWY